MFKRLRQGASYERTDNTSRRREVGRTIAGDREYAGLSQRALARRPGVSRPTIQTIEAGKVNVSFDTLCRIADALGEEVCELVAEGF